MTADEFREKLIAFRYALDTAGQWAIATNYRNAPEPEWVRVLDQVWRDLDCECKTMKDAETTSRLVDGAERGRLAANEELAAIEGMLPRAKTE